MPFHCDDPRTDRWSIETLDELYPMATAEPPTLGDDGADGGRDRSPLSPLVTLRYALALKKNHEGPDTDDFVADDYHRGTGGKSRLPSWSLDPRLVFQNVSLEQMEWQNWVHRLKLPLLVALQEAGYQHGWFFRTPIVDCPRMLEALLDEVVAGGGGGKTSQNDVDVQTGVYYDSIPQLLDEAKALGCDAVVNCTGLGAAKLASDTRLVGARGVLLMYDRATCVRRAIPNESTDDPQPQQLHDACIMIDESPWGSDEYPCYIIPRGDDTIVVGGTYLEGDDEPQLRPEERARLLENARLMGIDTEASKPKGEWVGFRPYRSKSSRCEVEGGVGGDRTDVRLVHCYGTGGSGWTVYTGIAKEATRLVLEEE